jgi:hypothetical protein
LGLQLLVGGFPLIIKIEGEFYKKKFETQKAKSKFQFNLNKK